MSTTCVRLLLDRCIQAKRPTSFPCNDALMRLQRQRQVTVSRITARRAVVSATVTAVATVMCVLTTPAQAAPLDDPSAGANVVSSRQVSATRAVVEVYSPSMDRVIANEVLRPAGSAVSPLLALLNGALGNEDGVGWLNNSTAEGFFADKNVTVVLPIGGRFSFYTDWQAPDPILGNYRWQTYLTRELPTAMEREYALSGRRAVAGLSMSGGPALDLAIQAPGVFDAAASFSGCPAPSHPLAVAGISAMIGGALNNPFNMWGPPGSPGWREHDPSLNADRLRGTAVYVSSSQGNPGLVDRIPAGAVPPFGGMAVEAMTNFCTSIFVDALRSEGVPATVSMRSEGAHTWALFEDQLREAWHTTLAPAMHTR